MIAFDQDLDAIDKVTKDLSHELMQGNLEIIHTNFANLEGELTVHLLTFTLYISCLCSSRRPYL